MANRFLTHFSTILAIHVLLLFGWGVSHSSFVRNNLPHLGASSLKLRVATEVLLPKPLPPKNVIVPRKNKTAPAPKEVVQEATSRPQGQLNPKAKTDLRSTYQSELRARIDANKFYPTLSRRLGQTGLVVVAFTLLEDGHIINIRIDSPSRFESLNASALEAVKKVNKFKPIPKELGESKMDIKVPLKFFTI